jgi:hypothetical protein
MRTRATRWTGVVVALTAIAAVAAGCRTTSSMMGRSTESFTMAAGPQVPAAQGTVKVTPDQSGNNKVEIKVEHVARPDMVFSGTTTHVVWLTPTEGGEPQNMGVIHVGDDREGKLTIRTPHKSFDILVTAEPTGSATEPSGNRELSASVRLPA